MTDAQLYKELSSLPDSLKEEVANFIAYLKQKINIEKKPTRPLGLMKGKMIIHKDFDNPVPGFDDLQ